MRKTSSKRVGIIAVAILAAICTQSGGLALADQAGPKTISLISGTTLTSFSIDGVTGSGASGTAATVTTPLTSPCTRYSTIAGTGWITGTTSSAACGTNAADGHTTTYTVAFMLPVGFTNARVDGAYYADNAGSVALNGGAALASQSGATDPANYGYLGAADTTFSGTTGFTSGQNTLTFTVTDAGGVTGLDYAATVSYDLPADLAVTVDDGAASAIPGTADTYTITASNNGPGDVTGAKVNDSFPSSLGTVNWTCTATPGAACPASGTGDLSDVLVNLPQGSSATFSATGTVDPAETGSLSDTATVTAPAGVVDSSSTNNTANDTDTLTPQADLGMVLSGVPLGNVVAGGPGFTATATVTNHGPSDSGGDWQATVTLPSSDLQFGAMPSGCGAVGLVATCSGSVLAPNSSVPFALPVSAVHNATAGDDSIQADIQPGAVPQGADTSSDSESATAHVIAQADLGVAWSGLPTGAQVAGQDSFSPTATVTNYGPSDSGGGWSATLSVPTGFAFTSVPAGCVVSGSGVTATCSGSNLDPTGLLGSATQAFPVTIAVLHNAAVGSDPVDASVAPGIDEGGNANADADHQTVPVIAQADLGVAWSGLPTGAQVAGQDSFSPTATVTNYGPSDSGGGWSATLSVPTGFAFTSVPAGCVVSGSGVTATCSGSNLDPTGLLGSATQAFPVTIAVLHNAAVGSDPVDASVAPGIDEGGNANTDADHQTVPVIALSDLALSVSANHGTGAADPYVAGDATKGAFSYVYTVTNNGPSDHNGLYTVSDTLPVGFDAQSTSACTVTGAATAGESVVCSASGELDPAAFNAFTLPVKVLHYVRDGQYADAASVATDASATPEPAGHSTNNSAHASVGVITVANLQIVSETSSTNLLYANTAPANTVTFTLTLKNAGPSDTQGISYSLPTLAGTSTKPAFILDSPLGSGELDAGATTTVTLQAHANPALGHAPPATIVSGPFVSTASAKIEPTSPTTESNDADNISANALSPGVTIDTVPSPVQNLSAAAGNANAVISWKAPASNGGSALDATNPYQIKVLIGSTLVNTIQVPTSAAQPCLGNTAGICFNVTGLTNGTTYTFDVQARNAVGLSDDVTTSTKPNADASATIIPVNTTQTLTTCSTATPAHPVCIQYIVPSGGGGVAGVQGNVPVPLNFCAGGCNGNGALDLVSATGFTNPKQPIQEIVTWDVTTSPNGINSKVYYQTPKLNGGLPFLLPSCKNLSYAAPDPCLKKINVLGGKNAPPNANGDVQVQINLTSDIDGLTSKH